IGCVFLLLLLLLFLAGLCFSELGKSRFDCMFASH
ncbi:uncharacterized protein Dwil_GK27480, partial [Drosophila willistoni]